MQILMLMHKVEVHHNLTCRDIEGLLIADTDTHADAGADSDADSNADTQGGGPSELDLPRYRGCADCRLLILM